MFIWPGISSVFAAGSTHPIDTIKVKIQVQGNASSKEVMRIVSAALSPSGFRELFFGFEPALWRGLFYGGLRYSMYSPIKESIMPYTSESPSSAFLVKILSGLACGSISSVLCNPLDLAKVRMQTWSGENQHSTWQTLRIIVKHEGYLGLMTGVGPTCARATVLAATELGTYDHFKSYLLQHRYFNDGIWLHLTASLGSGIISSVFSTPFDMAKTRLMTQPKDANGIGKLYSGTINCLVKSATKEGIIVLWSGFIPTFVRLGPNVMITFTCMEFLQKKFGK